MILQPSRERLVKFTADAVAELMAGRISDAKWSATFAGMEIARLRLVGDEVDFPAALTSDPMKAWADHGIGIIERAHRPRAEKLREAWTPRFGLTYVAKTATDN